MVETLLELTKSHESYFNTIPADITKWIIIPYIETRRKWTSDIITKSRANYRSFAAKYMDPTTGNASRQLLVNDFPDMFGTSPGSVSLPSLAIFKQFTYNGAQHLAICLANKFHVYKYGDCIKKIYEQTLPYVGLLLSRFILFLGNGQFAYCTLSGCNEWRLINFVSESRDYLLDLFRMCILPCGLVISHNPPSGGYVNFSSRVTNLQTGETIILPNTEIHQQQYIDDFGHNSEFAPAIYQYGVNFEIWGNAEIEAQILIWSDIDTRIATITITD